MVRRKQTSGGYNGDPNYGSYHKCEEAFGRAEDVLTQDIVMASPIYAQVKTHGVYCDYVQVFRCRLHLLQ